MQQIISIIIIRLHLLILMMCMWFILVGQKNITLIIVGLISSFFALLILSSFYKMDNIKINVRNYYKYVRYFIYLIGDIISSSFLVMNIIWQKEMKISPRFSWIKIDLNNNVARSIYANSITLTPGTLTIYTQSDKFFVHSLILNSMNELHLNNKIRDIL